MEQLIIIHNQDTDDPHDLYEETLILSELMEAQMSKYHNLRYFEFSLYNETSDPSFSQEQIEKLLNHLPEGIRECCIYTGLNFRNLENFIRPQNLKKFDYLELGCNQVF